MRLPQMGHCALSAVVLCAAFGSLGCPKLNRWSGPSQDPFFSVADRVGSGQTEPRVRQSRSKFESKAPATFDEDLMDDVVNDSAEEIQAEETQTEESQAEESQLVEP